MFLRTWDLGMTVLISKFLDAQRIQNLTTYLQELHSRGLANPDHTTLLLNCYTKTGDKARLDAFIKSEEQRFTSEGQKAGELPFDLDTAIKACRQAGFYEHATYLARRYGKHEEFLRIQIEDAEQYGDALRYLALLGPEAVSGFNLGLIRKLTKCSANRICCCTAVLCYSMSPRQRQILSLISVPDN